MPTVVQDVSGDSALQTAIAALKAKIEAAEESEDISSLYEDITNLETNKQDVLTFDSAPTAESTNPVTSAGVKTALDSVDTEIGELKEKIAEAGGDIFIFRLTVSNDSRSVAIFDGLADSKIEFEIACELNQSGIGEPSTDNVRTILPYDHVYLNHVHDDFTVSTKNISVPNFYSGKIYSENGNIHATKYTDILTFDGSDDEEWSISAQSSGYRALIRIPDDTYQNVWGSTAEQYGQSNYLIPSSLKAYGGIGDAFAVSGTALYVAITGVTTVSELKSYLSQHNLQICLTFIEPQENTVGEYAGIVLTQGFNRIWTNVGKLTVNYAVSVINLLYPQTVGSYKGIVHDNKVSKVTEQVVNDTSLWDYISSEAKSPQGIAQYGDYIFQFFADIGKMAIVDAASYNLINSFAVSNDIISHGNVLQFIGPAVNAFPLLMISEGNDRYLKIAKVSTESIELVGIIDMNAISSKNKNAIYDDTTGELYIIGTSLSDYTDHAGSTILTKCYIGYGDIPTDGSTFVLPAGTDITLPFTRVTQALSLINGNIIKIGSHYSDTVTEYYVINPNLGLIGTYTVAKSNPEEVEGSFVVQQNDRYALFVTEWSGAQNVNKRLKYKFIVLH